MGVIWLQQSNDRLIYLPVVGPDVNTPDSPTKIPASVITSGNRCLSGQVAIVVPGHGTITFDFSVPGRTGSCNQCGSCCTHPASSCPLPSGGCGYIPDAQYNVHKCQYLTINPGAKKLGKPGETSCSIYSSLVDGYKGCLHGPQKPDDIWAWMTACGYTFG